MVLIFWLSTVLSELFASKSVVITIKTLIPWGFLILIPALTAVGITGFRLSKNSRRTLVDRKRQRMPFIAANGILILIPSALFLSVKAQAGAFDAGFYAVQALELIAGTVNLALLGLNMRDGLLLAGKFSYRAVQTKPLQAKLPMPWPCTHAPTSELKAFAILYIFVVALYSWKQPDARRN